MARQILNFAIRSADVHPTLKPPTIVGLVTVVGAAIIFDSQTCRCPDQQLRVAVEDRPAGITDKRSVSSVVVEHRKTASVRDMYLSHGPWPSQRLVKLNW